MRRRLFPNFLGDVVQLGERQERLERVMQVLGITPEYPYTVNINDGTRNRVGLGLVDGDYGIKIVDNAGNEILLANGTIVANAIKTGTLDCSLITVTNLDAGSITVGYLSASKISGGTLNCSLMTVSNLNAGSITVGTFSNPNSRFTDEALSGVKITQNTIYGNRIVANSINADRIQAGTITADRITAKTITADRIQDNSLGTGQIIANGVNADRLVNASITNAKIADATIQNAKIANISADKINAGTLIVGSGGATAIYLRRQSGDPGANAFLRWEGGSRIWSDTSNRIGINSIGSPIYIYVNSWDKIIIPEDGQVTVKGGVYITATSGAGNLNVEGNMRLDGHFTASINMDGNDINNVGDAQISSFTNTNFYGNNIWYWNLYYYSDLALKKNIVNRTNNLADIMKLKPIEFEYKKERGKKHFGLIAQEVEKVLPNLVGIDKDGARGVDIAGIIPLLIGAVKELQKEVELLKGGENAKNS